MSGCGVTVSAGTKWAFRVVPTLVTLTIRLRRRLGTLSPSASATAVPGPGMSPSATAVPALRGMTARPRNTHVVRAMAHAPSLP
jgi:hypothetical protein